MNGESMKRSPILPDIQQADHNVRASDNFGSLLQRTIIARQPALGLISQLCHGLAEEDISYCHWKSNNALDRSASGDNDLDLLVSRADAPRFTELLYRLGFKQAQAPAEKQMLGVLDYYGYDKPADKLVHVHAHYQLIMGHDMTKNYRLPIEGPYLESAVQGDLFKVPAPEFEFIVFVLRMVLKHATWDAILGREGSLNTAERRELAYLQARVNRDRVDDILKRLLPYIDVALFDNCIQVIQPGRSSWTRAKTAQRLQARLQANARRPLLIDTSLKLWRRVGVAVGRRIFRSTARYRLERGGAIIAIVGGDGAGKSTAVDALYTWLSKYFETSSVHLGKPAWSWTTITIRGILKIGQLLGLYPVEASFQATLDQKSLVSPGYPWLIREICRARDRYWTYIKARRVAANGGLVILDRFPLPQIQLMDGPQAERFIRELMDGPQSKRYMSPHSASWLARFLVEQEERYYHQVALPELLIVLRVDPEIAVQRKTEEDAASVRERSTEIWELDWENTTAHVVDASQSSAEVVSQLKTLIWSEL
jgi:thymidylate kinase